MVSEEKSTVSFGKHVQRRHEIMNLSGFSEGVTPFNYFRVSILKRRPNKIYFEMIVDKVSSKVASWKGNYLTMVRKLQLIKSEIRVCLRNRWYMSGIGLP